MLYFAASQARHYPPRPAGGGAAGFVLLCEYARSTNVDAKSPVRRQLCSVIRASNVVYYAQTTPAGQVRVLKVHQARLTCLQRLSQIDPTGGGGLLFRKPLLSLS